MFSANRIAKNAKKVMVIVYYCQPEQLQRIPTSLLRNTYGKKEWKCVVVVQFVSFFSFNIYCEQNVFFLWAFVCHFFAHDISLLSLSINPTFYVRITKYCQYA